MTDPTVGIGIDDPRGPEVAADDFHSARSFCVAFGLKLYPSPRTISKVSSAHI